jgi:hypothetical protein
MTDQELAALWNEGATIEAIASQANMASTWVYQRVAKLRRRGVRLIERHTTPNSRARLQRWRVCPKCSSSSYRLNGHTAAGARRYECRQCGAGYSLGGPKHIAIRLFIQGVDIEAIAYYLDVQPGLIESWVKEDEND